MKPTSPLRTGTDTKCSSAVTKSGFASPFRSAATDPTRVKYVFTASPEDGFTNVGPTQIIGGDYVDIVGHGVSEGATDEATGSGGGTITGFVRVRP